MAKNFEDVFIRFDRMYEYDRQTDEHRMTAQAALRRSTARQKWYNFQIFSAKSYQIIFSR